MSDTQNDDQLSESQFTDRPNGDEAMNLATATAAGEGIAAGGVADRQAAETSGDTLPDDEDLGMRDNDELTDGDAVR